MKKDFNAMMNNNKDMPKTQVVKDEKTIKNMVGLNTIISKGTKNIKYYVKDYENSLIER